MTSDIILKRNSEKDSSVKLFIAPLLEQIAIMLGDAADS